MFIIGGRHKGHRLQAPKGKLTRPTPSRLRETVFNILQSDIIEAEFLDLFAGSGAMGLEALSRGAKCSTFIDSNTLSIQAIEENIAKLKVKEKTKVYKEDVILSLKKMVKQQKKFDLIYADPPYIKKTLYHEQPILLSLLILDLIDKGELLKTEGKLFIEEGRDLSSELPLYKTLCFLKVRKNGTSFLHEFKRPSLKAKAL